MYKSAVYKGGELLGEVEIYPQRKEEEEENQNNYRKRRVIDEIVAGRVIGISHFSPPSERCPPLAVLHTIKSGFCFKMESENSVSTDTPLHLLHSSCIQENKTAVVLVGGEELHLVAMYSRNEERQNPCFWGFNVLPGLYDSCLVMLNLRCLGIVFDLDETLVVANTMRSFEDRIEALQRKLSAELDPQRIAGMLSELKRYQDDKAILKQYVDNDQVVENGRVIKSQFEVVPAVSDSHQAIVRPLIRLQERNIILTRINPQIRDTSVLVRLRPAWEDLRSYLTARGRKRFEVYVCTMAERDYALEMWRLLDPDSNLINSKELLDRIVCVKSGLKKSLFNVFQNGLCHPKMALVIDDRLKVWDEKDQPRVHVVPAFAPYYAPQAEENNAIPVLCLARNVACNVRGGFFKEFDEGLLQKIPDVSYEDDIAELPSPPDVSSYLVSEDDASTLTGNREPPLSLDGMADVEVEKRLKEAISASSLFPQTLNLDPKLVSSYAIASSSFPSMQFPQAASVVKPLGQIGSLEPSLQNSPAREEGEVPESELDPDTRRRLLILQHGQDTRDPVPGESPFPVPHVQSHGNWVPVEEEMSPRKPNRAIPKQFFPKVENSFPPPDRMLHENQRLQGAPFRDDGVRLNNQASNFQSFSGEDVPLNRSSSNNRDLDFESDRAVSSSETPVGVLQDIATKCGAKVEFRSLLVDSWDLQFSSEVRFAGEKVGEGIGIMRREAQWLAAENSIENLANIYMSRSKHENGIVHGDPVRYSGTNGHLGPMIPYGSHPLPKDELISSSAASQSPLSSNSSQKDEIHAQVEIDGQLMGRGIGSSWDEAKMLAADKALGSLKSKFGQFTEKRQGSPRSMQGLPNKRLKPEFPRVSQWMPSSARYPKNARPFP